MILGGIHQAEELFDGKFFEKFRSQNIVELSVDYARAGDWRALDAVFTYHGEDVLPHRYARGHGIQNQIFIFIYPINAAEF